MQPTPLNAAKPMQPVHAAAATSSLFQRLRHLLVFELLPCGGATMRRIATRTISFIEAQHDCLQINAHGKGYLVRQRLASIARQLDPDEFVHVDRAYILNLGCINCIRPARDGHHVLLDDGSCVPVSHQAGQQLQLRIGASRSATF